MTALPQVSNHPLVRHKLTLLRKRDTDPKTFRELVRELSQVLLVEATTDLRVLPTTVQTPLAECTGQTLAERVGLVPILRAGLSMAEAMLQVLPTCRVWHLGLYRDHTTHAPVTYYHKLPPQPNIDLALVLDPMLATGGSAVAALNILRDWGVPRLKFVALIAAPEGVTHLQTHHPDVPIILGSLDHHLNADKYIVPGLGDAGDRQFGTF